MTKSRSDSRSEEHKHIYQRTKSNRSYRCIKPSCPHILQNDLLEHREAECPHCHKIFIITREHLRRKLIHCMLCKSNIPETSQIAVGDIADFLQEPINQEEIVTENTKS